VERLPVSSRCEKRLVEVDVIGCPAVKRRVRASTIVEGQIFADRGAGVADGVVGPQVNLLIFDRSSQALDEHVVPPCTAAVHPLAITNVNSEWVNRSHYFNSVNRNKRSLILDLRSAGGKENFLTLLRDANVVAENYTAGVKRTGTIALCAAFP
jgi:hypothetical protein